MTPKFSYNFPPNILPERCRKETGQIESRQPSEVHEMVQHKSGGDVIGPAGAAPPVGVDHDARDDGQGVHQHKPEYGEDEAPLKRKKNSIKKEEYNKYNIKKELSAIHAIQDDRVLICPICIIDRQIFPDEIESNRVGNWHCVFAIWCT